MKKLISSKFFKYPVILLVLVGVGTGGYFIYNKMAVTANAKNLTKDTAVKVVRGDLNVTISGTGTVAPIARYDIVPLVKGNILSAPFEEGMSVKKGNLLYKIDDSDLSYNIQKAQDGITKQQISNQQTADSLKNYEITAPVDGRLDSFTLKAGDQVNSNGTMGTLIDDKHLKVTLQFNSSQIGKIQVGQKAQLTFPDYMSTIDATVTNISKTSKPSSEGAVLYDVEVSADNPGGITEGLTVYGTVKAPDGDVPSPFSSTTSYKNNKSVTAQATGKVKEIYVQNGDWVKAGQKILSIDNSDVYKNIQRNGLDVKDSQLSLDAQKKQLNDYNILSPIDGTVIKKNYKEGDTINNGTNSTILMTVADLTKMVFTMDVDELDVAKINVGQKVAVIADALPGTKFDGEVTKVPMEGKTSNGVTTYAVEVTIASPGQLKPGMNVNAQIQVESKKDILYLPMAAVTKFGDKAFVFTSSGNTNSSQGKGQGANQGNAAQGANGQQRPQRNNNGNNGAQRNGNNGANASQWNGQRSGNGGASASGRQRKEVVIGTNNNDYIEIVSGLNEGDTVYIPSLASSTNANTNNNRNGLGGGFSGGFGGGAPGVIRRN